MEPATQASFDIDFISHIIAQIYYLTSDTLVEKCLANTPSLSSVTSLFALFAP
jgi:hypothetical protein